jgi:chloramphenicol 3-O phosphotransferase
MDAGTILLLNGLSSAGKSSILKAYQEIAPVPSLDAGIDKFLWMLPWRYLNTSLWGQVFSYTYDANGVIQTVRAEAMGDRIVSGMHHSIAALAQAGNDVIADHVIIKTEWLAECARLFAGLNAYFVAVRCPLDVLEARERSRKDRTLGQARALQEVVHQGCVYDFEVDTSLASAQECAQALYAFVQSGAPPNAFRQLREAQRRLNLA